MFNQAYAGPQKFSSRKLFGHKADQSITLFCGPDPADTDRVLIRKIVQVNTKLPSFVKPAAWDLIQQLLMKKPEQRISLDNVLKSPWMVRNCPHQ